MASRLIIFLFIVFTIDGFSQGLMEDKLLPTRQDTLRGSITPEREWWDLTYYHLDIKVEFVKNFKYIYIVYILFAVLFFGDSIKQASSYEGNVLLLSLIHI